MKLQERKILDDFLAADEPCLGAVFCTYTFDPAYFEDHVLRTLLRLQGDPEEDAARYHEEARAALRDTPVACVVDASVRRPGKRLPYDQLLVRERTFHPKLILVLYEQDARLVIGSGNLTQPGLTQNTELFFSRRLRYDASSDAALLRQTDEFLGQVMGLVASPGSLLAQVRETLTRRLGHGAAPATNSGTDARLVSTFRTALLAQLDSALPGDAQLLRIGVLAPFFEKDDEAAGSDEAGLGSVLRSLAGLRKGRDVVMDVGLPWEDAPLAPGPKEVRLADNLGVLWASRDQLEDGDAVQHKIFYVRLDSIGPRTISYRDHHGEGRRVARDVVDEAIKERSFWPIQRPQVFAPRRILERIGTEHTLNLWLHPAATLSPQGRPCRRPLHAKLFLITYKTRRGTRTLVLLGSPNASRAALAHPVEDGGNVEVGVLSVLDGAVSLQDVLPSLTLVDAAQVDFLERQFPVAQPDLSAWITDAVHDAAARTLEVQWAAQGPAPLGSWTLRYNERELVHGEGPPLTPTLLTDFELSRATAELILIAGDGEWTVPIRVMDLAALPINTMLAALDLRELLALLGRRVGVERITTLRAARGADGVNAVLEAIFGEGFGPTDVFKAWWGIAGELAAPLTVSGFRHRLVGPTGVETVWTRLREEAGGRVSSDEVWVYGCELLRTLCSVSLLPGADTAFKQALLDEVCAGLRIQLANMRPAADGHPWIDAVTRFYGVGAADA